MTFKNTAGANHRRNAFIKKIAKPHSSAGLTLVELLVSIVLGLLLTATVIQGYLSTKQTYRLTEGVSRVQENSRFGLHFIATDLREAGNFGCVDTVRDMLNPQAGFSFTIPIIGWDHAGTSVSDSEYTLPNTLGTSATNQLSNGQGWNLPAVFSNKIAQGSDVIILNSLEKTDVILKDSNSRSGNALTSKEAHGFENGQILMVGDCLTRDIFQLSSQGNGNQNSLNTSQSGALTPGNKNTTNSPWGNEWGSNDDVYKVTSTAYYIGIAASGLPALFQLPLETGFTATPIELVEGIETLQILYGIDTDADSLPNRYVDAGNVTNWNDVVSTRISMLAQSPENVTDDDQNPNSDYTMLSHLDIKHAADDRTLRYVINSTVKPRNLGVARSYTVCQAETKKTQTQTCNGIRPPKPKGPNK